MINLQVKICDEVILFPNAKINVGLRITAKRKDGYHDIETIFYPVKLCDALEFVVPEEQVSDEIRMTGTDTGLNSPEDNLVIKAVRILREHRFFPFLRLHLHKAIPSGAGLGGGSSDASCIIKSLNRHFCLGIPGNELKNLAGRIGSDCPFFIDNIPAIARGRGDILKPAGSFLTGYYIVLLNPGLHISTREAYENCSPTEPEKSLGELTAVPPVEWKNNVLNDFEPYAFDRYPLISDLKKALYDAGALFSLMSGSGSSVFGIFHERPLLDPSLKKFRIHEGFLT